MRLLKISIGALLLCLLSLCLIFGSCSKRERSAVGISEYPDSLLLEPDTVTVSSTFDSTYHHRISTGSSPVLLLGFAEECTTWVLFRFEKRLIDYQSASMHLPLAESLSQSIEFGIYRVSGDWSESDTLDWPFLQYDPTPLTQVSFSPGETLIVIDPPAPETIFSDQDTTLSWNFLFIPNSGGMVKLNSKESESDPTIQLYKDTDTSYAHVSSDAYVINGPLPDSLLWVGSGWVLRSDIKFDLSMLPPNSIINRAELILRTPTPSTKWLEILAFIPGAGKSATGYLPTDSTALAVLVTDLVQYWISNQNVGLTLKTTDETLDIYRIGFFSSSSPDRPYIHLFYTKKVYED